MLTTTLASYAAFCRKYGHHCTGVIGARNWNEEAIAIMLRDCQGHWETLLSALQVQSQNIISLIVGQMDWADDHLGMFNIHPQPRQEFHQYFYAHID